MARIPGMRRRPRVCVDNCDICEAVGVAYEDMFVCLSPRPFITRGEATAGFASGGHWGHAVTRVCRACNEPGGLFETYIAQIENVMGGAKPVELAGDNPFAGPPLTWNEIKGLYGAGVPVGVSVGVPA